MVYGILGAMPEEVSLIISVITNKKVEEYGNRLYYTGQLFGNEVVVAFSRWGKVAVATTTTHLILKYNVDRIIFSGIAGAISPELNIGDIVIAQRLFQHDMDARPLMKRFEIPLTGRTSYLIPDSIVEVLKTAMHNLLKNNKEFREILSESSIDQPKFMLGDIATGDLFISTTEMKEALRKNLPSAICAEMEGAAVAQVCSDYQVPLSVFRIISDGANEDSHENVTNFAEKHAAYYSLQILREYFKVVGEASEKEN